MKLPNLLTLLRIVLIPAFVGAFWLPIPSAHLWGALIFALAAVTDWLDGYLARHLAQHSRFGALFDPIADKMMVSAALLLLVREFPHWWLVVPSLIIIGREFTVSGLREWLAASHEQIQIHVKPLGKIKTLTQMLAILILLAETPVWRPWSLALGVSLLDLAALLTVLSGLQYLWTAWPSIRNGV